MWACQRWCHVCCFNNFQKRFNPPSKNEKMCTKQQYYYFLSYFCGVSLENYIIVLMFCYIKLLRCLLSDESFHCPPRFCSDHLSRHWLIQLMYRLNEWGVFNAAHRFSLILICVCSENHNIWHVQSDNPVRQNQLFGVAAQVFANFTLFFKRMKTWPLCKLLLQCCATLHVFLFEG